MNCILHFLTSEQDLINLESNYDVLYPHVKNQFVMSFVPHKLPNRRFEQLFYKNINFTDDKHKEYSRYFFLYQVNRFLLVKNYKRLMFINANTKLRSVDSITNLLNEITAVGIDLVKFNYQDKPYEDIFLSRIAYLDNNLDYANCTYETFCNRECYKSYDVYIQSLYDKVTNLENYI